MKKLYIILFVLPLFMSGQVLGDKELKKTLTDMVDEVNSECPIVVNELTTLMSAGYQHSLKELVWTYNYLDPDIDELSNNTGLNHKELYDLWLEEQKDVMTNMFCSDPQMKIFKDNVLSVYRYFNPNGNFIGQLEFDKSSCK